jgi:hypothetical protein
VGTAQERLCPPYDYDFAFRIRIESSPMREQRECRRSEKQKMPQ